MGIVSFRMQLASDTQQKHIYKLTSYREQVWNCNLWKWSLFLECTERVKIF